MVIYIQSRGKNQDEDYRWLRIKSNEYYPKNPDFLLQPISNLPVKPIDLIESQKFSIILVASRNDYFLLITGLESKTRTDFMGRPIRNSILCICKKDSENIKIRSLLILALRGELDRAIDKTIKISGKYGFEVDYDLLKDLSNSTLAIENNQNTDLSCKIGKNCDSTREELALELESNVLPNREGLLILVTSIKSASALKKTGVWRSLSNRVESEEFKQYTFLGIKKSKIEKKTIFLGIAIVIMLLIAIALIIIKLNTPETPQPEIIPIPSIIQQNSSNILQKKLNPSTPIQTNKINYLTSLNISREGYGI